MIGKQLDRMIRLKILSRFGISQLVPIKNAQVRPLSPSAKLELKMERPLKLKRTANIDTDFHFSASPFVFSMYRLISAVCLLCLVDINTSFGQGGGDNTIITKRFYSVEDGLASREVFCAIQDDDGFLWFGTRNGLNRFDGKSFKLFNKQKNGLTDNKVIQLAKDKQKHLFIVYGNSGFERSPMSVAVMDLTTKKLMSLKELYPNLPFDEQKVSWVANAGDDICFLTRKPYQYWRYTAKGFVLKFEMKAWDNANEGFARTTGVDCIFYKDYALLKQSFDQPQYFCSKEEVTVLPAFSRVLPTVYDSRLISPDGRVAFTWNDVYDKLIRTDGSKKSTVNIFDTYLREGIAFYGGDYPNALVYRPKDGLFFYDFRSLTRLLDRELLISSTYSLSSYFIDRQQNIWVCTSGGLIKIKLEKNHFTHYFTKKELRDSSVNQTRGIYDDGRGNIYASLWTKLGYNSGNKTTAYNMVAEDIILYGITHCMNKTFVAAAGIYSIEPGGPPVIKRVSNEIRKELWALDSLAPGKLLVGYIDSMQTFDIAQNTLKGIAYPPAGIPPVKFVYRFIIRKDKTVWAVAENGMYLLNAAADSVIGFYGKGAGDTTHRFPFSILHDAYEDDAGIIWLATNGEGLFRWNRDKHAFSQFNTTNGLPSDILYRIESDSSKNLWISTDNGLAMFNTGDYRTSTYSTANGISHNEFNRTSSFKAQDGRLYFGGLDGVNAFYPNDFTQDPMGSRIPMRLISFNKFSARDNQMVDETDNVFTQNKIVLQPADKFFTLEFQLLDFDEGKLNYAFKIEGVDKDWNYISENSIRVSGLPYGEHTLRIKGQSHSGQWSKNELSLPLLVLKPFYLQWWFIIAMVALLALAITAWYRWRVRQLIQAKLSLEQGIKVRTKALEESLLQEQSLLKEKDVLLKEIHHRVKNNLQVISGLLELQEKSLAEEGAKQALHEGRTRVRSMALIHQNLYQYENLSRIELSSFTHDLYDQVNGMYARQGGSTKASIQIPVTEIDIDTAVPFGLMLNELLTNSFKYGYSGDDVLMIEMMLHVEQLKEEAGSRYIFTYGDSGPGLPAGFDIAKTKSLGMRLIWDLTKQMGGNMQYAFEHGSRFTITFYDKAARYKND